MMKTPDLFSLGNKVCIVTGAAGIIGRHVAAGLLSAGAKVALFDVNAEANQKFLHELQPQFGRENVLAVECDVSQEARVRDAVEKTCRHFGGIDVLVNNAASKSADLNAFFASFEDYSLEEWKKIMSVNVDGMMLMAQAVGRQMKKQRRGGSIIQTASIYGVVAPDQRVYEGSDYMGRAINTPAVYSASKGAVLALTSYLATYWAQDGIRVNALTPGGVESGQNETFKKNYSNRVPMGRMAQASEMVGAVLYLASDASSYVTGQNLIVDGGLTAW